MIGLKIKNIWNHHPDKCLTTKMRRFLRWFFLLGWRAWSVKVLGRLISWVTTWSNFGSVRILLKKTGILYLSKTPWRKGCYIYKYLNYDFRIHIWSKIPRYLFGEGIPINMMTIPSWRSTGLLPLPYVAFMYGIFTYVYLPHQPNLGKYTIHGWYGIPNRTTHSSLRSS